MTSSDETCGIIILAAGSSSRLGRPKQLLRYKNKSLIQLVFDEAIKVANKAVIVVSGANKDLIETALSAENTVIVYNNDWQEGMASSIRCGVTKLVELHPLTDNIILTVCDQPFLSADIFQKLIDKRCQSGKPIIASFYNDTLGVPVLFNNSHFNDLLKLEGQSGAKKLIDLFAENVAEVSFPEGGIDIDTAEDYDKLLRLK